MIERKKILIVEDEESLLGVLRDKFTDEGFEVATAIDGEDGINAVIKNRPDIILLDVVMPKMDGIAMLRKMKEDKIGSNIPVIMLTNLSDSRKVAESIEQGVSDYLIKSDWKLDELVEKVRKTL